VRGHLIRRSVVTIAKFSYFWAAVPDRFQNLEEVVDDWLALLKRWFCNPPGSYPYRNHNCAFGTG
jgi:hypothetical protein